MGAHLAAGSEVLALGGDGHVEDGALDVVPVGLVQRRGLGRAGLGRAGHPHDRERKMLSLNENDDVSGVRAGAVVPHSAQSTGARASGPPR